MTNSVKTLKIIHTKKIFFLKKRLTKKTHNKNPTSGSWATQLPFLLRKNGQGTPEGLHGAPSAATKSQRLGRFGAALKGPWRCAELLSTCSALHLLLRIPSWPRSLPALPLGPSAWFVSESLFTQAHSLDAQKSWGVLSVLAVLPGWAPPSPPPGPQPARCSPWAGLGLACPPGAASSPVVLARISPHRESADTDNVTALMSTAPHRLPAVPAACEVRGLCLCSWLIFDPLWMGKMPPCCVPLLHPRLL